MLSKNALAVAKSRYFWDNENSWDDLVTAVYEGSVGEV
jgi:hypothetical protein